MSKNKLTIEQQKELQMLADDLLNLSTKVVEDYKLNPSEISGSVIRIHQDSTFLSGSIDDTE